MASYRMTVRYGEPRPRYHMEDVEAASLPDALRQAAESLPDDVAATAELVEIRRMRAPEEREYAPG